MTTAQWRTLTLVLAVIFLVLVALLVVVILGRTGSDDGLGGVATSTPSATHSASASPGGGAPTPPGATVSPPAAGSPSSSSRPSSSPSETGTVPATRAIIRGLGIDDPARPGATPRVIVFTSDGGGDVAVRLQDATGGKVQFCLYPGTLAKPVGDPACLTTTGSTLTGHAKSKKPFTWTVTLVAAKAGKTPVADLRIDWPATTPRLEIIGFRFQGKGAEPYNGVRIDLAGRPTAGALALRASWSDPAGADERPFAAAITDRDSGATLDSAKGDASEVALAADLAAKQRAAVSLTNTGPITAGEVLGTLALTWP